MGVKVKTIGVGICKDESRKKCGEKGCWVNIDIGSKFSLIDANTTAIVGPTLGLKTSCGCRRPFFNGLKSKASHPTAHALIEEVMVRGCTKSACLNGGKCIPSRDGFK